MLRLRLVLCLAVVALWVPAAAAQTAQEVVGRVLDRYRAQAETVDDFTVYTDLATTYHKKTMVDGQPVYRSRTEVNGMPDAPGMPGGATSAQSPFTMMQDVGAAAEYRGTEDVEGREAHVLYLADGSVLMPESEDQQPGEAWIYVDADRDVPVKMTFTVTTDMDGESRTFTPSVYFEDYRTTDGLLYPWRTRVVVEGMAEGMDPDELAEAQRSLEEMEQRLKELPAEQRQMVERMMKPQLERFREIVESGRFEMTQEVERIEVNTGLTDEQVN